MSHLWPYALLVAGIIVLPGMDMAFVAASALADGRRGGLAALAGIVTGGALHMLLALAGLGLLLQAWPAAFNALLVSGALYIGWLGGQLLCSRGALLVLPAGASRPPWRTFLQAAATCLSNPKAAVFMLAVVPQFLRPEHGPLPAQALVMALITALVQVLVYGSVAMGAAGLRARLAGSAAAQVAAARAVGGLLLATAAWALLTGWRTG